MSADWIREDYLALATDYPTVTVRLSAESLALFLSTYDLTTPRSAWRNADRSELTAAQWDEIQLDVDRAYRELMTNPLVGTMFSYCNLTPPDGSLTCDGVQYARVDYPELYAVLHSAFIVDADNFVVPDTRGRVIVGSGLGPGLSSRPITTTGGAETVTLDTSQIPSHNHGIVDPGHVHTEGIAVPAVGAAIVGVPVPSAIPGVGVTGASVTGVSVTATGGGLSHPNVQPYMALRHAIWAK